MGFAKRLTVNGNNHDVVRPSLDGAVDYDQVAQVYAGEDPTVAFHVY